VDDEPWAVLSLTDGAAVADPFRPSAAIVVLLRERARLLGHGAPSGARRRRGTRYVPWARAA
jgi:hypothetical protein